MRDGQTRQLQVRGDGDGSFQAFRSRCRVSLVVLAGGAEGTEYEIEARRVVLGRSEEADLRFDDRAMSKEHALLEFSDEGFRVRDLDSSNGTRLNGAEVRAAEVKHGDRLEMGTHAFQLLVEPRRRGPRAYVIPDPT